MIFRASKKKLHKKLLDAIDNVDLDMLRRAIEKGADVNYSEKPGRYMTPLLYASYKGNLEAIKCLIHAGADINTQADSAADMAFSGEPLELIEGRGETAVMEAVRRGHTTVVAFLLETGADPNRKDRFGETALHYSASWSLERDESTSVTMAQALLAHGANIEAATDFYKTALQEAAWVGRPKVVKLLLDAGANPNSKDHNGNTALMGAAHNCDAILVDMLLRNGADPNTKRTDGETALSMAEEKRTGEEAAQRLRQAIYTDSGASLGDPTDSEEEKVARLIGLKDLESLKTIGKSVLPALAKWLNDDERSNRKFARYAIRSIDVSTFLDTSRENSLMLNTVLEEGMANPIPLRVIFAKEREDLLGAIVADIATLPDYYLFVIDWPGEAPGEEEEIEALFDDGVVYVWSGVEGGDLIRKRLLRIAADLSSHQKGRCLLLGPLGRNILMHANVSELSAAIYHVDLREYLRNQIAEIKNSCDSCEQYQIVSAVAADDRLLNRSDAKSLRRYIDERAVNLAEPILRTYYNSL